MRRLVVLALAPALGLVPAAAQSYKPEFKNSLVTGPSGPWGEAAVRFAERLEERSQGRINVKNEA
jgi:TRAP-type C4-dicarboxylate transport system substrate-binding protein